MPQRGEHHLSAVGRQLGVRILVRIIRDLCGRTIRIFNVDVPLIDQRVAQAAPQVKSYFVAGRRKVRGTEIGRGNLPRGWILRWNRLKSDVISQDRVLPSHRGETSSLVRHFLKEHKGIGDLWLGRDYGL